MNEQEFKKKFDELIKKSNTVLVSAHIRPDEDAICSALALKTYIDENFDLQADVAFSGKETKHFAYLPGFDSVEFVEDISLISASYDTLVLLDGNDIKRFGKNLTEVKESYQNIVRIDHHKGLGFDTTLSFVDSDSIATCSVLYKLFFERDKNIEQDLATLLLIGIMADSGSLRFVRPRNAETLEIVGRLLRYTDETLETIHRRIYSIPKYDFEAFRTLIENSRFERTKDGIGFMYTYLPKDMYNQSSVAKELYMHSVFRMVEEHGFGFIVTHSNDLEFRISFRSVVGGPNVRLIAEDFFEGGGHDLASGGRLFAEDEYVGSDILAKKIAEIIKNADLEIVPK